MVNSKYELKLAELNFGTKNLDLSNCDLLEFPHELLKIKDSLEFLNLGGNSLSSLPSYSECPHRFFYSVYYSM